MSSKVFNFRYIVGAFLLIFTPLFIKTPLFFVSGIPTPMRLDDFVYILVIICWLIWVLMNNKNPFHKNPLNIPILIYFCSLILSTALGLIQETAGLSGSILFLGRNLQYIVIFYLFYSIFDSLNLKTYLKIIFGTSLLVILVDSLQVIKIIPIDFTRGAGRFATFSASYDFGAYLVLIVFLAYSLLFYRDFLRQLRWFIFIFFTLALINADSRASLFSFILILILSAFILGKKISFVVGGLVLSSLPILVFTPKIRRFLDIFVSPKPIIESIKTDPSLAMRFDNWSRVLNQWFKHPVFGGGLSSFLTYVTIYNLPGTPDSWYFRILAESGIVGLIAFGLLIFFILKIEYKLFRYSSDLLNKYFSLGILLATLALLINGIFVDIFVAIKIGTYFWILIAMLAKIYYETFNLHRKL